ncbi:hypothetical protein KSP39_PZI022768 [Platanthera zijinensis]|uniref:Uncharacterized protein n=1 Tax=Platanthera zijinensis TaxID=2320716 RepID=A0AAP0AV04_9ASPA
MENKRPVRCNENENVALYLWTKRQEMADRGGIVKGATFMNKQELRDDTEASELSLKSIRPPARSIPKESYLKEAKGPGGGTRGSHSAD